MAIDYVIDYDCLPKQTLGTQGILERLKGRARAEAVIRLFRENGDDRPASEMGFEFTRNTPDGAEESRVIVVQDLLDEAAALDSLEAHCAACPANMRSEPFGCIDAIHYPLSARGEAWLLEQLPGVDEPLPWMLLRQSVTDMGYDGKRVEPLRATPTYFEETRLLTRDFIEFAVSSNQVFEMLFLLGHVQPAHAGAMLMFFGAIRRDGEADEISTILNRALSPAALRQRYPFRLSPHESDDQTIGELKAFLRALYIGWSMNTRVLLDV